MRVLELFAGIGACSKALERLGIEYEIVDAVEIDKYAITSFNAIHGTNFQVQDITAWDKDIEVDLIMHGSPCQDISVAGKQEGADEGSGTRSSLMYETIRIVEKLKPKYVIWENVKNLLSKKHIHNFNSYIDIMDKLGFNSYYKVLNAKNYGIPQNRERVFTVSIRKDLDKGFTFPEPIELDKRLKDLLEPNVDEKFYLSDKMLNINRKEQDIAVAITTAPGQRVTDNFIKKLNLKEKLCDKLIENKIVKGGEIINHSYTNSKQRDTLDKFIESKNGIMPTITTRPDILGIVVKENNIVDNLRIRKLTPLECWRLMGFSDEDFEKAKKSLNETFYKGKDKSASQLYKQARKFNCCKCSRKDT